jgi:hypothetical protein
MNHTASRSTRNTNRPKTPQVNERLREWANIVREIIQSRGAEVNPKKINAEAQRTQRKIIVGLFLPSE